MQAKYTLKKHLSLLLNITLKKKKKLKYQYKLKIKKNGFIIRERNCERFDVFFS